MTTKNPPSNKQDYSLSVKVTGLLISVLFAMICCEIALRFIDELQGIPLVSKIARKVIGNQWPPMDIFEEADPERIDHWRLKPSVETGQSDAFLISDNDVIIRKFRTNSTGFKGEELSPKALKPRILFAGDSCTFGVGALDYPFFFEKFAKDRGILAEIINGGVEGYLIKNIRYEIKHYQSVSPRTIVLYIGWNDIFNMIIARNWFQRNLSTFKYAMLSYNFLEHYIGGKELALSLYNKPKILDKSDPDINLFSNYELPFTKELERVIDHLREKNTNVVLVTLPSIYQEDIIPDEKILNIGHLPEYTNNPYAFISMVKNYNRNIRQISLRKKLQLIDLEKWANQELQPKEEYFNDSVHLNQKGIPRLAYFLASQLTSDLNFRPKQFPDIK